MNPRRACVAMAGIVFLVALNAQYARAQNPSRAASDQSGDAPSANEGAQKAIRSTLDASMKEMRNQEWQAAIDRLSSIDTTSLDGRTRANIDQLLCICFGELKNWSSAIQHGEQALSYYSERTEKRGSILSILAYQAGFAERHAASVAYAREALLCGIDDEERARMLYVIATVEFKIKNFSAVLEAAEDARPYRNRMSEERLSRLDSMALESSRMIRDAEARSQQAEALEAERKIREQEEAKLEQARRHEKDCADSLAYVQMTCSTNTGKESLNAGFCAVQQAMYRSKNCDEGDLAAATAAAERSLANARSREREAAVSRQANLNQIRNANACASAEAICRQNANLCADARRGIADSGVSCPNFDSIASQATSEMQMRQQEAARVEAASRAEQQRQEEQRLAEQRRLGEQRRLAEAQQRQRAQQLAADQAAARARADSQQRQAPSGSANAGTFTWTHFDRYFKTQGADRMNYAVHIQNTGTAAIRCGGNVQAQPAGYGVPQVSPFNIPVPPGQTIEIAVLQNIVDRTGTYQVNCRVTN